MAELSEYGPLGLMVIASATIIGILWKFILNLLNQNRELNEFHTKRFDESTENYQERLQEILSRYETVVKELVAQAGIFQGTLETLQEGLAAKDLLTDYIAKLHQDRK